MLPAVSWRRSVASLPESMMASGFLTFELVNLQDSVPRLGSRVGQLAFLTDPTACKTMTAVNTSTSTGNTVTQAGYSTLVLSGQIHSLFLTTVLNGGNAVLLCLSRLA